MEDHFGTVLSTKLAESAGVSREEFVVNNEAALNLYVPKAERDIVEAAIKEKKTPPVEALEIVMASDVGQRLYAKEGVQLRYEAAAWDRSS